MIDDKLADKALHSAWKAFEKRHQGGDSDSYGSTFHYSLEDYWVTAMLDGMEEDMESVRKEFYEELARGIPRKESRTSVDVDGIADLIRKAAPSLVIGRTKDGITVEVPGDVFGVSVYKGYKVSVHSRKHHRGWDATMWEPDDIAAAIVTMGRFEELNAPMKEAYRVRCEERKRRADIKSAFREANLDLRRSVYSALDGEMDTAALRDEYVSRRKALYADLGDPFDDAVLEKDWKEFADDVADRLRMDREEEARKAREEARERALDEHAEALSRTLGRDCWIVRRSPYAQTHWDEYLVELSDGERVWFKDYTRTLGSLDAAIAAVIPALEELTGFATTLLKFGTCPSPLRYSAHERDRCRKVFLRKAGDEEDLLYLAERLQPAKLRTILRPTMRTVKLYCYYPHRDDGAVSFTLGGIGSKEDIDRLADAIGRFQAAMKKHRCNLG